jgi:manganese transport protein
MFPWHLPKIPTAPFCPTEVQGTVTILQQAGAWRTFLAFAGPGLLIFVGYMDPGNWATDIAGGVQLGYNLPSVIFLSNLIAILWSKPVVTDAVVLASQEHLLCYQ